MDIWSLLLGVWMGVILIAGVFFLLPEPDNALELERLEKKRYKKLHKDKIKAEKHKKKVEKEIDREVARNFRRLKKSYARGDDFELILKPDNCNWTIEHMVELLTVEMHRFGLKYHSIEINSVYKEYALVNWTEK